MKETCRKKAKSVKQTNIFLTFLSRVPFFIFNPDVVFFVPRVCFFRPEFGFLFLIPMSFFLSRVFVFFVPRVCFFILSRNSVFFCVFFCPVTARPPLRP